MPLDRAQLLGPKLAVIRFQIAAYLRLKLETLKIFSDWLQAGLRAGFESRHRSWLCEDV